MLRLHRDSAAHSRSLAGAPIPRIAALSFGCVFCCFSLVLDSSHSGIVSGSRFPDPVQGVVRAFLSPDSPAPCPLLGAVWFLSDRCPFRTSKQELVLVCFQCPDPGSLIPVPADPVRSETPIPASPSPVSWCSLCFFTILQSSLSLNDPLCGRLQASSVSLRGQEHSSIP